MRGIELLGRLRRIGKPFYTIADLEKVTNLSRGSLFVALGRWTAAGYIERIGRGLYAPVGASRSPEKIAAQLCIPSYLSFESALSLHGILNLVPYAVTFATTRKPRRYTVEGRSIEFRQIARPLFFGFDMNAGLYTALPEKAFLDLAYFAARGRATLDLDEMDPGKLSARTLTRLAEKFPPYVRRGIKRYLRRV
jgi:predicted transcriptional regulator of viral defense system